MPFTYHSHSGQFCLHASGDLEAVVRRAIEVGFSHIGLSEHMPRSRAEHLYDEERHLTPRQLDETFAAYVAEARRLRAKYASQIHVVIGMETEFLDSGTVDEVKQLVDRHQIEYLVGSVHHVHGVPTDYSAGLCNEAQVKAGGTVDDLFQAYFDHQFQILTGLHPKVVGHFDVIRLFRQSAAPLSARLWEAIDRNIQYAVSYGALFELNSRALKKQFASPYPQEDIARRILALGGKFTLCDDSHGQQDIAMHYDKLRAYLERLGIDVVYLLESEASADGKAAVVEKAVVWRDHPFWKGPGMESSGEACAGTGASAAVASSL